MGTRAAPYAVMTVFGTRPEAIKMAPVVQALAQHGDRLRSVVVVTAQHREMLDQVLAHFSIHPDYDLDIMRPRQSLTAVTVRALKGLERVFRREQPDLVLVHGDTTTTFAASLAAFYRKIPVGHVEAGLRTGVMYSPYPEEMNRRLTGSLTHLHFAPTARAKANLLAENVPAENIHVTGNTAIDALLLTVSDRYRFASPALERLDFAGRKVVLVDAHRRENFGRRMRNICLGLRRVVREVPGIHLVFSVHRNPAVEGVVRQVLGGETSVTLCAPLPYPEWANLMGRSYLVITDSGGLQEEAPSLGTPVLLLRDVTERPEALEAGTVKMVGTEPDRIFMAARTLLTDREAYGEMARAVNPYGDGQAARRIVQAILYRAGLAPEPPDEFGI